jgi:hypothetical protein
VQLYAGHPAVCALEQADYYECLHGTKLVRSTGWRGQCQRHCCLLRDAPLRHVSPHHTPDPQRLRVFDKLTAVAEHPEVLARDAEWGRKQAEEVAKRKAAAGGHH